jgi:diphosphate-dependent phosphofructokinase
LTYLVEELVNIIVERWKNGKDYGVVLVPEGIVEFVGEMNILIKEINHILSHDLKDVVLEIDDLFIQVNKLLTKESANLLNYLPRSIGE